MKLNRKEEACIKIQTLQTLQVLQILLKMALARSWSVVRGAHIQAFTFSSQDHGRLPDKHISKHSLFFIALKLWHERVVLAV